MTAVLLTIAAAYLVGAVPFGLIVARLWGCGDLRSKGSGNIGATNVLRVVGRPAALVVLVLDIAKGALPVLAALHISQSVMSTELFAVLVACAAILGHVFPVYLGFKGGKGVNTAFGSLVVIMPVATLVSLAVFVLVTALSRFVSMGSITGALTLPATLLVRKFCLGAVVQDIHLWLAFIVALLIVVTHIKNLQRLVKGTESKLNLQTRKADANA